MRRFRGPILTPFTMHFFFSSSTSGDLFAHHLKEYAQAEKLNNSSTRSLTTFAENFAAVQDYRDTEVTYSLSVSRVLLENYFYY